MNKKGFTLVELIMIIVILGILAAVAIPKYIDMKRDAELSVAHGITGALQGAIAMLHARYLLKGTDYDYSALDVINQVSRQGVTLSAAESTITATLSNGDTFTWIYTDNSDSNPAEIAEAGGF